MNICLAGAIDYAPEKFPSIFCAPTHKESTLRTAHVFLDLNLLQKEKLGFATGSVVYVTENPVLYIQSKMLFFPWRVRGLNIGAPCAC